MGTAQEKPSRSARFGGFQVDLKSGELTRQGRNIRLADKPFQVLIALLEQPGEVVSREDLRRRLWTSDTFVDFDNNMNAAVSRLREALNDSAQGPRFVETIPRRGYRYVGPPPIWNEDRPSSPGGEDENRHGGGWRLPASLIAATVAVLVLAVFLVLERQEEPASAISLSGQRTMIAVLPFENLGEEASFDYLANGLTEEVLSELGRVSPEELGVIARTSVRQYLGTEKTVQQIGRELGVAFVVEGSIRVEEDRLRATAQLIRVSDQTHVWTESYDRSMTSILDLQIEIATAVAASILPRLGAAPEALDIAGPKDPQAYRAYLQGRYELSIDAIEPTRRAIEHFEHALELEPNNARYWVGLAEALNVDWFAAESSEEAEEILARARDAANQAMRLDPGQVEARVALAFSELYHRWNPWGAIESLVEPLAEEGNSAVAYQLGAAAFASMGRHDDALALIDEALILDPASPNARTAKGWYLLFAGRSSEAEALCRSLLEELPGSRSATECLYRALLAMERESEAIRVMGSWLIDAGVPPERFDSLDPGQSAGALRELEQIRLEQIFAERETDPRAPFDAATAYAQRGEIDQAFAALEMAFDGHDHRMIFLAVDPRFGTLRSDARFESLLARVGIGDMK